MTSALVVAGGWAHPAELTGPPMADALESLGLDAHVVTAMDDLVAPLLSGPIDLLVVHTCRFQMRDARYSDEQRAEYRYVTSPAVRRAMGAHLGAGRPVLGMHTAVLSFDDWDEWPGVVGGRWDWERSNHPPPGMFRVDPEPDHHVTRGLHPFDVVDELYRFVVPAAGSEVIATAVDDGGVRHPLAWVHHSGAARVAFDSLGHDHRSLGNSAHRDLLGRTVGWLLGN